MTKKTVLSPMFVAAIAAGVFLPAQAAVAQTATQTNILSTAHVGGGDTGTKEAQGVTGSVAPAPTAGEKVVVKFFKRHSGDWVLRGTHRPKTDGEGVFSTKFRPVAKHGTCKATAHYKGDDTYDASHTKVVFDCATGQVKQ